MTKGVIIIADNYDVYQNLALEEYLFDYAKKHSAVILFFWINERAVVIGRHQNAYIECNLTYAQEQGIKIARRKTGGGAVYHDKGNLNYSIITPRKLYDVSRSTKVIIDALKDIGIETYTDGRNDICLLLNGKKISGNAYHLDSTAAIHHGTILYNVDFFILDKVLNVPKYKLAKHGIRSVRSRVTNLKSNYPTISIGQIIQSIRKNFVREYGLVKIEEISIPQADFQSYIAIYNTEEWNIGLFRDYSISLNKQFDWGNVILCIAMNGTIPYHFSLVTDALEISGIMELESAINANLSIGKNNLYEIIKSNLKLYIKSEVIRQDLQYMVDIVYKEKIE